jgi:hypothetical protein
MQAAQITAAFHTSQPKTRIRFEEARAGEKFIASERIGFTYNYVYASTKKWERI